jgi:hypothetical protein
MLSNLQIIYNNINIDVKIAPKEPTNYFRIKVCVFHEEILTILLY